MAEMKSLKYKVFRDQAMEAHWGIRVKDPLTLNVTLYGYEWFISRPGRFNQGK
jgi:hypothetical protein